MHGTVNVKYKVLATFIAKKTCNSEITSISISVCKLSLQKMNYHVDGSSVDRSSCTRVDENSSVSHNCKLSFSGLQRKREKERERTKENTV